MEKKNKNITIKEVPKNNLFKNKVIISYDDFQKKLSSILETENETFLSNNQYNQMINVLFDENKFKIRNDFDSKHCKKFLKEKEKSFQPINLNDTIFDGNEKIEYLNRISSKFTFGHH